MTSPSTTSHLSDQQLARVDALKVAREVLAAKAFVSSGAVDPAPLIDIADYVITGQDRWFDAAHAAPEPDDIEDPDDQPSDQF
ncbi:hypothetical protein [Gordonia rubripertincta]|uniref:hypothetical protein n=1 Tax=Gordonia rubripertincta TaxID=36822 RepID=UPI0015FB5367|nr:hypothetical protein [Gordonia rubripertincta]QMU19033.1 hypothetical protein H3V45_13025 [Gordonia rubripertincta]